MIYREWRIKVDWTRDIVTRTNPPHFVQNDTHAVRLTIDMVNDRAAISASTNYRLMVLVVRPDGQAVINQADWIDENTAELILDQNMLAVPGKGRIHLGLFGNNGERLTHEKSLVFIVGEDPGFCDDDTIIGTTEYGILSQLIQEVKDIQTASQLQYMWDGDRLGIKRIDEDEYTFSPSLTGPQGPKGDPVESLPWDKITDKPPLLENFDQNALSYVHYQGVPEITWTIHHHLNKKEVAVTVYDSSDRQVYGQIELIDSNTARITFSGAFSGKAYVV